MIDGLFDQLEEVTVFFRVDLRSRYHVKVKGANVSKISFEIKYGNYKFLVMSFILSNALAILMNLMNHIFKFFVDQFVINFIDDILMYFKMDEEHENHLMIVLELLKKELIPC